MKKGGWGIFARSFLVQASWSYRGMQNLGFATMMLPALRGWRKRRGLPAEEGREALAQTEFFNTHPYLAAAVAGLSLRLREEAPDEDAFLREQSQAKESFMGPLGTLGDDFFWATLRPLAGGLGILTAMSGHPWTGILLFLGIYNLVHLWARWAGLRHGLEGEGRLLEFLERSDLHRRADFLRRSFALLFVVLPLVWVFWGSNPWRRPTWLMILAAFAYVGGSTLVLRRLDPRQMVLLTLAGALAVVCWRRLFP